MKPANLVCESGDYFVIRSANNKGWDIFHNGATAATKVAHVGDSFGMTRVRAEIKRRQEKDVKVKRK